jgi:hypothetical protein
LGERQLTLACRRLALSAAKQTAQDLPHRMLVRNHRTAPPLDHYRFVNNLCREQEIRR